LSRAAVGTVTEQVNTPASIQRDKQTLTGAKGTGVEMNDSIRTQSGKLGITFQDDTKVQVNENSKLVIDDFVYDPKSKSGKLSAKMALGTVRYASGQIAKNSPQNVALNTPTATISVRGTDFTASVDELGQSTVILLPSCPTNRTTRSIKDIESNCHTGEISVETDAGMVILNQPFQATKVNSRSSPPSKPVTLNLSENAIESLLISTPDEMKKDNNKDQRRDMRGPLDIDFLKEQGLTNALDDSAKQFFQDKLSRNFLDNNFLANMFDMVGNALNEKLLEEVDSMLPDYKKASGIIVTKDDPTVTLCRDNGADRMCITTPQTQNSTLYMTQNNIEFKNRVNQGNNTIISLTQK
jgi:glutamine phosphoribosylpyrophosphate amidotransferase